MHDGSQPRARSRPGARPDCFKEYSALVLTRLHVSDPGVSFAEDMMLGEGPPPRLAGTACWDVTYSVRGTTFDGSLAGQATAADLPLEVTNQNGPFVGRVEWAGGGVQHRRDFSVRRTQVIRVPEGTDVSMKAVVSVDAQKTDMQGVVTWAGVRSTLISVNLITVTITRNEDRGGASPWALTVNQAYLMDTVIPSIQIPPMAREVSMRLSPTPPTTTQTGVTLSTPAHFSFDAPGGALTTMGTVPVEPFDGVPTSLVDRSTSFIMPPVWTGGMAVVRRLTTTFRGD